MANKKLDVIIKVDTFYDLGLWLSHPDNHTPVQLTRLQNEDSYLAIIALANHYWLIGRLTDQLMKSTVWPFLPSQLTDYLTTLSASYQQRNNALKQEATEVCMALAQANVRVMLLKSSAGLFNGLFSPLSRRFMYDIDLLVPEENLAKCVEILKAKAYKAEKNDLAIDPTGHQHAPPLKKEHSNCYVELHRWPLPLSVQTVLTTSEVWHNTIALPIALADGFENKNILELSATYQIILTIAHSELADNGYEEKRIELRQLTYLYDLIVFADNTINWQVVEQHFKRANQLNALHMCLYQLKALFNLSTPLINSANETTLKKALQQCLVLFEKNQDQPSVWQNITSILKHYRATSILDIYGDSSRHPVLVGRIKLFSHHLKLALNFHYLKQVIVRVLNKD